MLISDVNPRNVTLELTESGYIGNGDELQALTESFANLGVNVDIDDFGTGYSNLRYLQYLKANTLKLDYTFVQKATGGNEGDRKIIKHITQMAHELGMQVCMEGIEEKSDIEKLIEYSRDSILAVPATMWISESITCVQMPPETFTKKQNSKAKIKPGLALPAFDLLDIVF